MLDRLKRRLHALLHKRAMEREIDEELRYHLEREIERNVGEGMNAEEARFAALRSFGGVEQAKEQCQDARGVRWLEDIWQDLRYGALMLWKNPGFTLVAVLMLALGIGANTAIFSIVNATLLKPLPFSNPEQIMMVWENDTQEGNPRNAVAPANFVDWREQSDVFDQLAFFSQHGGVNLTGAGEPERVEGVSVSTNLFPVLGVKPVLGRTLLPEDETDESSQVVVLSYGFWQRRFGADPNVIGKKITLDGEGFTVVGVMPSDFQLPEAAELWSAWSLRKPVAQIRGRYMLRVIGRLKPNVSHEQAQAQLTTVARRLEGQYPETNTGRGVTVVAVREQLVGELRSSLLVLLGAVGFVLLIACANLANLSLARGMARHKEVAVRQALGATRLRLVRQLLTESVLLAVVGGTLGIALAVWGIAGIIAVAGSTGVPYVEKVSISWQVLCFTLGVSLITGLLFGLIPALQSTKPDLNEALKDTSRGSTSGASRRRTRDVLLIVEVAFSLILLVGAGLLLKSFLLLQQVEIGFDSANTLTAQLSLPSTKYGEAHQRAAFYDQLVERVGALPGVRGAAIVSRLPLAGDRSTITLAIEGKPVAAGKLPEVHYRIISPNYFRVVGSSFAGGREFTPGDTLNSQPVVIVNESLARTHWSGEDAKGKRIKLGASPQSPWVTVVGVVKDARNFGLDSDAKPEAYFPYTQDAPNRVRLIVRTASDPLSLAASVRSAVGSVDKDLPLAQIKTMERLLADSVAQRQVNMLLVGIFASAALLLAATGLYGVMSYAVAQRKHEIGIRMALGARKVDVLKLVVGQGMTLAALGVGLGLVGAFVVMRVTASLLYGVSTTDPVIFTGVTLLLTFVAFIACYIPARRATKVDPLIALRYE